MCSLRHRFFIIKLINLIICSSFIWQQSNGLCIRASCLTERKYSHFRTGCSYCIILQLENMAPRPQDSQDRQDRRGPQGPQDSKTLKTPDHQGPQDPGSPRPSRPRIPKTSRPQDPQGPQGPQDPGSPRPSRS
uniref:Uncharacterized protein n=1 Tax=Glossina brevipalpis TaxID=37001 RepID=A0A1A9WNF3_9MUSC